MDVMWVIVVAGAALAGFVQGLTGFGFSLVALSVWAWALEPRLAAVMAVFGGLTGQVMAAATVRRGFDFKRLLPFAVGGLLGVPVGILILPHLDMPVFKAILGLLLTAWCPAMLVSGKLPRITWGGRGADGAVGWLGGILGGLGGFTGLLPTLWCTLRGLPKDVQRALIQNLNLMVLALTMVAYLVSGLVTRDTWPYLLVVAPAMLIPAFVGTRVYTGISELTFRRVVLGLLTASGLAMLGSAIPELSARWF